MSTATLPLTPASPSPVDRLVPEIRRCLDLLHKPRTIFEVRGLGVPSGRWENTVSGYFDDFAKAAVEIARLEFRKPKGIYVTINPVNAALLARTNNRLVERPKATTQDSEIVRRRWFFVDIDPYRPSGIAATDEEVQAARDLAVEIEDSLRARGWPVPLIAESGNGCYLLWRVDLPNDERSTDLIKRCYNGINSLLGICDPSRPYATVDTGNYNPARILRIGGTTNRKGDPTTDRPHRICVYHEPAPEQPIETVDVELLRELAGLASSDNGNGRPIGPSTSANGSGRGRLLVDRYLADHGVQYTVKADANRSIYLVSCPFESSHGHKGETAVVQRADGLVCFECKHASCSGRTWRDYRDTIGTPDPQRHYDPPLSSTSSTTHPKPLPPIEPGTVVLAGDRGNFGTVQADNGSTCTVHFRSPEGNEATKELPKSELRTQDGRPVIEGDSPPIEMRVITAAELDQGNYELKYLVEGFLVEGQPAILAGMMKTLTTTILIALTVALVLGDKFLGIFNVPRAVRVGMVSCESGLAVLQETFRRICIAYGVALADLDGLFLSDTIPRLENPAAIAGLADFCRTNKLDVLILDPAYLMMSGLDAANVFSMGEKLAALNMLAADARVTIILAHHLRKNRSHDVARYSPPDLEEIAWSGFCEFARQWLLLGRRSEYEDGSGFHDLWLRVGGSAGHNSLWGLDINEGVRSDPGGRRWEVEVKPGGEIIQTTRQDRRQARADQKRDQDEADQRIVIEALSKLGQGEGAFPRRLRALTGISSHERLERLVAMLVEQGIVEECEALQASHHKRPKPGAYRLTEAWWNVD